MYYFSLISSQKLSVHYQVQIKISSAKGFLCFLQSSSLARTSHPLVCLFQLKKRGFVASNLLSFSLGGKPGFYTYTRPPWVVCKLALHTICTDFTLKHYIAGFAYFFHSTDFCSITIRPTNTGTYTALIQCDRAISSGNWSTCGIWFTAEGKAAA